MCGPQPAGSTGSVVLTTAISGLMVGMWCVWVRGRREAAGVEHVLRVERPLDVPHQVAVAGRPAPDGKDTLPVGWAPSNHAIPADLLRRQAFGTVGPDDPVQ